MNIKRARELCETYLLEDLAQADLDQLLQMLPEALDRIEAAAKVLADTPCPCISAEDRCGACRALRILRSEE